MNALRPLLFLSLVSLSVLATCGGGSKEDPVAVCKQGCSKYVDLCASEFAPLTPAQAKTFCETGCSSTMGGATECKNASAIAAAGKMCLSKTTCAELTACTDDLPDCDTGGSTGTGGSSGTGSGGSSGTGTGGRAGTGGASGTGTGGSGTATGSCATLQACCGMITDATNKATCQAAAANATPTVCDSVIMSLKAQGVTCQ